MTPVQPLNHECLWWQSEQATVCTAEWASKNSMACGNKLPHPKGWPHMFRCYLNAWSSCNPRLALVNTLRAGMSATHEGLLVLYEIVLYDLQQCETKISCCLHHPVYDLMMKDRKHREGNLKHIKSRGSPEPNLHSSSLEWLQKESLFVGPWKAADLTPACQG